MNKGKILTRLTLAALTALLLAVFGAQGAFAQLIEGTPVEPDEADVDGSGGYCSNNATSAAVDTGDDNDLLVDLGDLLAGSTSDTVYQEGDGVGTNGSDGGNGNTPDRGLGRTDGLQRPRALAGDTGEDSERECIFEFDVETGDTGDGGDGGDGGESGDVTGGNAVAGDGGESEGGDGGGNGGPGGGGGSAGGGGDYAGAVLGDNSTGGGGPGGSGGSGGCEEDADCSGGESTATGGGDAEGGDPESGPGGEGGDGAQSGDSGDACDSCGNPDTGSDDTDNEDDGLNRQ